MGWCVGTVVLLPPLPCGLRLGNWVCVSGRWSCSDPCLCGVWGTGFVCRDGGPAPTLAHVVFIWATGFVCRDGGPAPTLVCVASGVQGLRVGMVVLLRPLFVWRLGCRVCVLGRWSCSDPCLCGVWGT